MSGDSSYSGGSSIRSSSPGKDQEKSAERKRERERERETGKRCTLEGGEEFLFFDALLQLLLAPLSLLLFSPPSLLLLLALPFLRAVITHIHR
jgi:hypothetical protein